MNSESLKKSKIVDQVTGEEKFNFSRPTIMLKDDVRVIAIHLVKDHEEMRPDLISVLYYGTPSYVDLILKMNGISNPFSLKFGQFIRIPDKAGAERYRKNLKKVSNKPRTQFTDTRRLSKQDEKRKQFLEQRSKMKTNGSSENLPPNMLKSDQKSKTFKNGKIILGSNLNTKDN
jgi:hypothetical protein